MVAQDDYQRFFDIAKLHLAVLAVNVTLSSFALTQMDPSILFVATLVLAFGFINACIWWLQADSASVSETRFFLDAATLKKNRASRMEVGVDNLNLWDHSKLEKGLAADISEVGELPEIFKAFAVSLSIFYLILLLGGAVYARSMLHQKIEDEMPINNEVQTFPQQKQKKSDYPVIRVI